MLEMSCWNSSKCVRAYVILRIADFNAEQPSGCQRQLTKEELHIESKEVIFVQQTTQTLKLTRY